MLHKVTLKTPSNSKSGTLNGNFKSGNAAARASFAASISPGFVGSVAGAFAFLLLAEDGPLLELSFRKTS